ncbi:MAG TPA: VOC family protein [Stellaceae bacterium]|nr:VOC family protein [Stellaceae bacterium]
MRLNPYLQFDGRCKAAFTFYEAVFGGKIVSLLTFGETPMGAQCTPEGRDKIAHARLMIGDQVLMGSDPPAEHYEAPKGYFVTVNVEQPAEAERIFHALAEQGRVTMPLQKTFWAVAFGMLVDRFGISWMINCEAPR